MSMKTPAEAAECWCPKAVPEGVHDTNPAGNRRDSGDWKSQCHCLGPHCMWWRWEAGPDPKKGFCGVTFHAPWA